MSKPLTLGSLFDGSGGFPLGGLLCGITPLWASEVEPFPIRVTSKRLPQMKHLGDLNKIDGSKVPPVDIITGGFCCQDLSVAGKRAGLHGQRSCLFFQVVRIIKEMLAATNNEQPKYAVLENVPGMYSSAGGADFLEVLNELIKIKDETLSISMPESGKWSTAGEIVGDGFSIGWRTLDAQFWGVAQRRRRCYIVLCLNGERAGEILFDESRLRGNPPPGGFPWQRTARNSETGSTEPIQILNDQGGSMMSVSEDITGTLRAQEHGHAPITYELGVVSRLGRKGNENLCSTLRADMGDNQTAVVYDARGNGDGEIANTITGDHENRITDYTACVLEPKTLKIRAGREGGGKGCLIQNDKSATLSTSNDQTLFVPKAYGICSQASNSMKSPNPNSGIYEAETARTLDTSVPDPNKNAGGMAVVSIQGSMIGRKPENGPQGSGIGDGVSFTLTETDKHGVAYAMTTGCYAQICEEKSQTLQARDYKDAPIVNHKLNQTAVENHQHSGYRETDIAGTLVRSGGTNGGGSETMVIEKRYVVRRLTPQECAMLQGFSPDWCVGLETPEPSEDDIAFWSEVWETHRMIIGTSSKPKSRSQIIKWLKNPHSDSAEYKMWGNGVALPCVVFVLSGIVMVTGL